MNEEMVINERRPRMIVRFKENVEASRAQLLEELNKLPPPLGRIAREQYLSRIRGTGTSLMLSEYTPWVISNFVGVEEGRFLEAFALPWLMINAYTLFLDDVLDDDAINATRMQLLIAGGVLLESGLVRLNNLFPSQSAYIDEYFRKMAAAVSHELESRFKSKRYDQNDLTLRGNKIGVMKLCAALLLSRRHGADVVPTSRFLLRAIDDLAAGIQLFDDIQDCEEDYEVGNYTYPLCEALRRLHSDSSETGVTRKSLKAEEIYPAVVMTGSFERSVVRSVGFLERSIEPSAKRSDSLLAEYLREIIGASRRVLGRTKQLRIDYETHTQKKLSFSRLSELAKLKEVQKRILLVKEEIRMQDG